MRFQKRISHINHFTRFKEVSNILIKHGFGFIFDRVDMRKLLGRDITASVRTEPASAPVRLRYAIQELGPTYIKLGQLISTRPDLVAPQYLKELEKLQNDVPPFSFQEVLLIFKSEGIEPERDFAYISPEPIAAASIAQVHEAALKSGDKVVVKVQRPGIEKMVHTDLEILGELAKLIEKRTYWGRFYKVTEIVNELAEAIINELDFEKEARNADIFYKNYQGDKNVIIPRVYWNFTHKKVLTLEYVEGVKISDISGLKTADYNLQKICTNLVDALFKQIYEHGFFHADPHPGNLAIGPGEKIVFYDFGQIGVIDDFLKENCIELLLGMMRYDVDKVTRALLRLGAGSDSVNRTELKREVARLQQKYYGLPLSQIKMGEALGELVELSTRFRIRIPPELSLMAKMLMTVENIVAQLHPQLSIVDIAEPYGRKVLMKKYSAGKIKEKLQNFSLDYASLLSAAPRELEDILGLIKDGELKIKLEHTNLRRLLARADVISNRISLAIILASIIIGTSLIVNNSTSHFLNRFPLVEAGFALAMILGLFLVYSIMKSGKY
ncbi:MAG TPA: ABC transporter [Syntrophomonas sp.]|nr:ABC transporter [Syntrophomonas sp.]